ncbi:MULTISPECIES: MFS transporter [Paenibacillus]|uniref:MFS transporter n=1 Tax=Paenibacillus campinasensis TaxID=66347 RepID=A0ABW9T5H8_9BACL|nr:MULTISPECIES: MFS transporter [Paenibacillus]MUG68357.1 MFS transporter [Paenibacillus campinasensis]PAK53810.1 MFS transporter [Paenibacillus sp. 7541]
MRRKNVSVFISVFVAMLGVMILAPITPSLIRELGLREIHSGILISSGSIMTAVMAPIWGRISDRKGRKPVILVGLTGMALSTVFLTLTFNSGLHHWLSGGWLLFLMILTRSMVGMFIPAILSASQALMGDGLADQEQGSGMAVISAANGMGLILGPAIAGIFSLAGLLWPLYFGIVIIAAALIITLFLMPASKPNVQETKRKLKPFQRGLRLYLFAAFVTMMGLFTIQVIGGFYLQDQLGLPSDQLAWVVSFGLMLTGLAMLITQIIQSKWLQWTPATMILIGSLVVVVGMVIFLLANQLPGYYFAFFLLGTGAGFTMTGFMVGASVSVTREQQGNVAGLVTAVQGISAIVAPIVSTSLYHVDLRIPMAGIALLSATMGLIILSIWRKRQKIHQKNGGFSL